MHTRELHPQEWVTFFDGFSRTHRGVPMTIQAKVGPDIHSAVIARRLPLVGISAEPRGPQPEAIHIVVGTPPLSHISHTIRQPTRLSVSQVSDGEDELLIIESPGEATTVVDFCRHPAAIGQFAAGAETMGAFEAVAVSPRRY
jgi:hypothetical protein